MGDHRLYMRDESRLEANVEVALHVVPPSSAGGRAPKALAPLLIIFNYEILIQLSIHFNIIPFHNVI